jgi:phage-related protein
MQRRLTWVKAALRDFGVFPESAQRQIIAALRMAAGGEKAQRAKPMKGFGPGIFEIALRHRGDAYRVVYALQIDEDVWVLHAFQKKSRTGISTPKQEIDLIRERIRRIKEQLR